MFMYQKTQNYLEVSTSQVWSRCLLAPPSSTTWKREDWAPSPFTEPWPGLGSSPTVTQSQFLTPAHTDRPLGTPRASGEWHPGPRTEGPASVPPSQEGSPPQGPRPLGRSESPGPATTVVRPGSSVNSRRWGPLGRSPTSWNPAATGPHSTCSFPVHLLPLT